MVHPTQPSGAKAALCVIALLGAFSCAPTGHLVTFDGATMGTTYSVKVATLAPLSGNALELLRRSFEDTLADINQKMSTYISTSELSRFNQFGAGEPYAISTALLSVLIEAEDVYLATQGAFDPTVGPAVDLWGFGAGTSASLGVPSDQAIGDALALLGWSKVRLDRQSSTILKTTAALNIDLSAIAKGYAVDQLAERAQEAGLEHYLVEVGGELRASGYRQPGSKDSWLVGIEAPPSAPGARQVHRLLHLQDGALATSGDYRNRYEIDGISYSHTIDPETARPVTHRGASVSVLTETCSRADALATALLVMGPERGLAWAERNSIAALFLVYNEDGSLVERRTNQMNALLVDSAPN